MLNLVKLQMIQNLLPTKITIYEKVHIAITAT